MATLHSLADLGREAAPAAPEAPKHEQKLDAQGRAYATGKRKDAVARVWIKPGPGQITVNEQPVEQYFARPVLRMILQQPLHIANRHGQYDIVVTVAGGGLSGQAGAVRHGLAKALTALRAGASPRAQEGRLPDPRPARRRAQEVRQEESPPQLPVLEALSLSNWDIRKAASAALFCCGRNRFAARLLFAGAMARTGVSFACSLGRIAVEPFHEKVFHWAPWPFGAACLCPCDSGERTGGQERRDRQNSDHPGSVGEGFRRRPRVAAALEQRRRARGRDLPGSDRRRDAVQDGGGSTNPARGTQPGTRPAASIGRAGLHRPAQRHRRPGASAAERGGAVLRRRLLSDRADRSRIAISRRRAHRRPGRGAAREP